MRALFRPQHFLGQSRAIATDLSASLICTPWTVEEPNCQQGVQGRMPMGLNGSCRLLQLEGRMQNPDKAWDKQEESRLVLRGTQEVCPLAICFHVNFWFNHLLKRVSQLLVIHCMRCWVSSMLSECNEHQKCFLFCRKRPGVQDNPLIVSAYKQPLFPHYNVQGSHNTGRNMTPSQLATFLCISTVGVKLILWCEPEGHFLLESMNQKYEVKHNLEFMGHKLLHLALTGTRSPCIPFRLLKKWL